jgi:transposase
MDQLAVLPPARKRRRRHSVAFKAEVVAACGKPGASVAGVALAYGLNANLVHKWRLTQRQSAERDFVRLPAPAPPAAAGGNDCVRIDVPHRSGLISVHWPVDRIAASVEWLKALTG